MPRLYQHVYYYWLVVSGRALRILQRHYCWTRKALLALPVLRQALLLVGLKLAVALIECILMLMVAILGTTTSSFQSPSEWVCQPCHHHQPPLNDLTAIEPAHSPVQELTTR